jgi:hypothetical protein
MKPAAPLTTETPLDNDARLYRWRARAAGLRTTPQKDRQSEPAQEPYLPLEALAGTTPRARRGSDGAP